MVLIEAQCVFEMLLRVEVSDDPFLGHDLLDGGSQVMTFEFFQRLEKEPK